MDDQNITALLWSRSESALQAISDTFGRRLYSIASNILDDSHDAEECVNDTLLALWNAIPPQRPNPLIAYACRVVRNIALNKCRQRRGSYHLSLEELADCLPGEEMDSTIHARLLGRAINTFLGTLSPENRRIFLRRYWFGDSVKEIAADFALTENAVSVRLVRIRDKLKHYLIKEGYSENG